MTELSTAVQAVLDAFTEDDGMCRDWKHNHYNLDALSAALRAVADQSECLFDENDSLVYVVRAEHLIAIANELEAL